MHKQIEMCVFLLLCLFTMTKPPAMLLPVFFQRFPKMRCLITICHKILSPVPDEFLCIKHSLSPLSSRGRQTSVMHFWSVFICEDKCLPFLKLLKGVFTPD